MRQTDILPNELSAALKGFEGWVDKFESTELSDTISGPLFHYTKPPAFDGIVRNEELWLTSIFQLNDPVELKYGMEIVVEEIRKQVALEKRVVESFAID